MNFSFCQGCYFVSDFAWPNLIKAVLLKLSLRFEIVIFNGNFTFCLADFVVCFKWLPDSPHLPTFLREMTKRTNVFYRVCLKKYLKKLGNYLRWGLFCESCVITYQRLLKVNQTLCEKFEEGVD